MLLLLNKMNIATTAIPNDISQKASVRSEIVLWMRDRISCHAVHWKPYIRLSNSSCNFKGLENAVRLNLELCRLRLEWKMVLTKVWRQIFMRHPSLHSPSEIYFQVLPERRYNLHQDTSPESILKCSLLDLLQSSMYTWSSTSISTCRSWSYCWFRVVQDKNCIVCPCYCL